MPSITDIRSTVSRVLASAGDVVRTGTLRRATSAYDTASGSVAETVSEHPCRILHDSILSRSIPTAELVALDDGRMIWIADVAVRPLKNDTILVDGETLRILKAEDASAGAGAMYQAIVV
ncbi:hypothetical protein [Azospirillum brasilense]|uniref:hypothetical protein n=1 Tax=Azospirillum brasilense TaxID=192 RepID=UPI000E6A5A69|nr:hypothetical protein [Azospirillum brasilense]NUB24714.1 hypothetical protein [Azospirillum brasilense]NUB30682.1 hypothetical protein [Azospirillum brasilense]RIW08292.1 hypothetical protein D2T81_00845 [Azospirillum brasilense]